MMTQLLKLIPALLALFALNAVAVTRYVDLNSPSPTPPYTSWPTAATNIQDAIDVATNGDTVLVTNGIYNQGGRLLPGSLTSSNRVTIHLPITLQSVNGPQVTTIEGYQFPGQPNSTNSLRCVAMTNGSSLIGFTLTGGGTEDTGGAILGYPSFKNEQHAKIVSNCVLTSSYAGFGAGGALVCTLNNCVVTGNSAGVTSGGGGGAIWCVINNSVISSNWARGALGAGGAYDCTLNNCLVQGNTATNYAGGVGDCVVSNSVVAWNAAKNGGGVGRSVLVNSILLGNRASGSGGGAFDLCTLTNCLVVSNSAAGIGGGATYGCTLVNCTVVGNTAANTGGASSDFGLYNCILYYNEATTTENDNYYPGGIIDHCCTPVAAGVNCVTNAPLFVDLLGGDFRLQTNSPCINSGRNGSVGVALDLAGNPRIAGGTVDIGAYEVQSPASLMSYAWAQQYGLLTDGSADFTDADSDGANNWQEWRADTIPTDTLSVLRMVSATNGASGLNVTWQSVATRSYWLERATNLGGAPAFFTIATNVPGSSGVRTIADTGATNGGPYFYRVGVQP